MPWRGLEPRRLSAPPPQDGVSTNFTTRANPFCIATEPTGLEPATSRVTVECSNQTELRLLARLRSQERRSLRSRRVDLKSLALRARSSSYSLGSLTSYPTFLPLSLPPGSPSGNRTPLCTVKGCRPNR